MCDTLGKGNLTIQLTHIGVIYSLYKKRGDAPRQGRLSDNKITLEIYPQFTAALKEEISSGRPAYA